MENYNFNTGSLLNSIKELTTQSSKSGNKVIEYIVAKYSDDKEQINKLSMIVYNNIEITNNNLGGTLTHPPSFQLGIGHPQLPTVLEGQCNTTPLLFFTWNNLIRLVQEE